MATNPYFQASGSPGTKSPGSSAVIRAQFAALQAAFDKFPGFAGNGGRFVRVNPGESGLDTGTPIIDVSPDNAKMVTRVNAAGDDIEAFALDGDTYTPIATPTGANPSGATVVFKKCRWTRVGNIVRVSGFFTSGTNMGGWFFSIPLPVPSTFSVGSDCSGLLGSGGIIGGVPTNRPGWIFGTAGGTVANFSVPGDAYSSLAPFAFDFSYEVI